MAIFADIILTLSKLIVVCLAAAVLFVFGAIVWAANEIDGLSALISPGTIIPIFIVVALVRRGRFANQRMTATGPF